MCLLLNCLCDLAKKEQCVQLYSYFLFRVNLNQKIMTHENNATDTLDCDLWSIDPHRSRVISYVQRTFSSMSLFGCAVIALLIIILKKYKSTVQRLIFWLSVSGFLRSLAYLLTQPQNNPDTYCRIKGFFLTILRLYDSIMGFDDHREFFTYS